MVRPNADQATADDGEHLSQTAEEARSGWERTLQDMELMAGDREDSGYDTLTLPAADTTPKAPDSDDDGEWGLSYIVGDSTADDLEAFDRGLSFDETAVYQASSGGHMFIVTECIDHDAEAVLFVAGTFQLRHAGPLVRIATDNGGMHTYVKRLDGTTVRHVAHDDAEAFFPDPERILSYEGVDH